MDSRRRNRLWLVLLAAFVLRAGFGLFQEGLDSASDERHWDGVARAFLTTGLVHPDAGTYRPPLYPLVLASVYTAVGHEPAAVRVLQAALGTGACALLFLVGRDFGGAPTGLLAAGMGAFHPMLVAFTGALMVETLLVFLVLACVQIWIRTARRPTLGKALLFGFASGAAALTKPVVLVWLPLACVGWFVRTRRLKTSVLLTAVAAAAALLTIAPWTARNLALTGDWVLISSNLGMNLMVGNEPGATGVYDNDVDYLAMFGRTAKEAGGPAAKDRSVAGAVLEDMAAHPVRTLMLSLRKALLFWSPVMPGEGVATNLVLGVSSGAVLALGLAGLFALRGTPYGWVTISLALAFTMVHAIFFAHVRFRLPVEAALLPAAAWMLQRLAASRPTR